MAKLHLVKSTGEGEKIKGVVPEKGTEKPLNSLEKGLSSFESYEPPSSLTPWKTPKKGRIFDLFSF